MEGYEGANNFFHIVIYGSCNVIMEDEDKEKVLAIIHEARMHTEFDVHAYCVMPDHIHLLVLSSIEILQEVVDQLMDNYNEYYSNTYTNIYGGALSHMMQEPVLDIERYFGILRYIHNNPVYGCLVTIGEDYLYSSMKECLKKDSRMLEANSEWTMETYDGNPSEWIRFHKAAETNIYIDTLHDLIYTQEMVCNEKVREICDQYQVETMDQLTTNPPVIRDFVNYTRECLNMSYDQIADISGLNKCYMQRLH